MARMSRAEVETRISEMGIELPPLHRGNKEQVMWSYHPETAALIEAYFLDNIPHDFTALTILRETFYTEAASFPTLPKGEPTTWSDEQCRRNTEISIRYRDYFAAVETLCSQRVMAAHASSDREDMGMHPQAREALFQACLQAAVQRSGLDALNVLIKGALYDARTANGCAVWSQWRFRNAPRVQKETAVIEFLSQHDDNLKEGKE